MTEFTLIGFKNPVTQQDQETGKITKGIYLFFTSKDEAVTGLNVDKIVVWEHEKAYKEALTLKVDSKYDIRFSRYGNNKIDSFDEL